MKPLFPRIIASSVLAASAVTSASADIFYDNFDHYTGNPPTILPMNGFNATTVWYNSSFSALLPAGWTANTVKDSGNLFGHGTNSNYLHLSANNITASGALNTSAYDGLASSGGTSKASQPWGVTGQMSFEFYQPAGSYSRDFIFRMSGNRQTGGAVTAFAFCIVSNGEIRNADGLGINAGTQLLSTFSSDQAHTLDVVFNNSATLFEYGAGSVASQRYDIYLDGELIGDDLIGSVLAGVGGGSAGAGVPLTNLNILANAGAIETLYIDNFRVIETPDIQTGGEEPDWYEDPALGWVYRLTPPDGFIWVNDLQNWIWRPDAQTNWIYVFR